MQHHVNLRLSDEQLALVEVYRKKLAKDHGVKVSRSDAIRSLMMEGIRWKNVELEKNQD